MVSRRARCRVRGRVWVRLAPAVLPETADSEVGRYDSDVKDPRAFKSVPEHNTADVPKVKAVSDQPTTIRWGGGGGWGRMSARGMTSEEAKPVAGGLTGVARLLGQVGTSGAKPQAAEASRLTVLCPATGEGILRAATHLGRGKSRQR